MILITVPVFTITQVDGCFLLKFEKMTKDTDDLNQFFFKVDKSSLQISYMKHQEMKYRYCFFGIEPDTLKSLSNSRLLKVLELDEYAIELVAVNIELIK